MLPGVDSAATPAALCLQVQTQVSLWRHAHLQPQPLPPGLLHERCHHSLGPAWRLRYHRSRAFLQLALLAAFVPLHTLRLSFGPGGSSLRRQVAAYLVPSQGSFGCSAAAEDIRRHVCARGGWVGAGAATESSARPTQAPKTQQRSFGQLSREE